MWICWEKKESHWNWMANGMRERTQHSNTSTQIIPGVNVKNVAVKVPTQDKYMYYIEIKRERERVRCLCVCWILWKCESRNSFICLEVNVLLGHTHSSRSLPLHSILAILNYMLSNCGIHTIALSNFQGTLSVVSETSVRIAGANMKK